MWDPILGTFMPLSSPTRILLIAGVRDLLSTDIYNLRWLQVIQGIYCPMAKGSAGEGAHMMDQNSGSRTLPAPLGHKHYT